jgi:hypothetical protein
VTQNQQTIKFWSKSVTGRWDSFLIRPNFESRVCSWCWTRIFFFFEFGVESRACAHYCLFCFSTLMQIFRHKIDISFFTQRIEFFVSKVEDISKIAIKINNSIITIFHNIEYYEYYEFLSFKLFLTLNYSNKIRK